MANNRLYIVDETTGEYACIAKSSGHGWSIGNVDLLREIVENADDERESGLLIGTEADDEFFEKWIKRGKNINAENKWIVERI